MESDLVLQITHILLKAGANPLAQDQNGCVASHHAALQGRTAVLRLLVQEFPATLGCTDRVGMTHLMNAAQKNNMETCQHLISEQKVDVEQKDHFGRTAVYHAAFYNSVAVVRYLLSIENIDCECLKTMELRYSCTLRGTIILR